MPNFDGDTFIPAFDAERLGRQARLVFYFMARPVLDNWYTLEEISEGIGCPEASVSARLRDFRKPKFGGHFVDRRRRGDPKDGLHEYRLTVRRMPEQNSLEFR